MRNHYVDYKPRLKGLTYDLFGRILTAVHLAIVEGADLAVDWPDWEERRGFFGKTMRVFGSPEDLFGLNIRLAALIERRAIACGNLSAVPKYATETWVYVRDRAADRQSNSRMRRLALRAEERGEPFELIGPRKKVVCLHALPMQSSSTGNRTYRLDISRHPAGSVELPEGGKSFGFGRPVPRWESRHGK